MADIEKISKSIKDKRVANTDRYESIRPEGFSEMTGRMKDAAIGAGVRGAGALVKEAAKASIPGGVVAASFDEPADQVRGAIKRYKQASDMEDAAERELQAQNRREARGMKKGGMTASKRADGIAQRGKTRGKMV